MRKSIQSSIGQARWWHLWLGVVLALPLFLVALTGILKIHERALGLTEMTLPSRWAPKGNPAAPEEVRAILREDTGVLWVGGKFGLLRQQDDVVQEIAALQGKEVRALLPVTGGLLAAAKQGLWHVTGENAAKIQGGDFFCVAPWDEATIIATAREALWISTDNGQRFTRSDRLDSLLATVQSVPDAKRYTVANLVMDVHTGRTFFGKDSAWIWCDGTGITWMILTVTGVWIWLRRQRASRAAKRRASMAPSRNEASPV